MNDLYSYYLVGLPESETNTQITDIPASFHRTNPYPLDLSSTLKTAGEETYKDLVEAARDNLASYTGQLITINKKDNEVKGFILYPKTHKRTALTIGNVDKNLSVEDYAEIETTNPELSAEELAFKDDVYNAIISEKSARLKADLIEETRASNAEAAVVGGSSYLRNDTFTDYTWSSGKRTLSYRGSIASTSAEISSEIAQRLEIKEGLVINNDTTPISYEAGTNIPTSALFLVAIQTQENKTSYAEFTLLPGQTLSVQDLALLGQSFDNATYYVFDNLNYIASNGSLATTNSIGTVRTHVTANQNENAGWWLTDENNSTHEVSSLIDIEDALLAAHTKLITVSPATTMEEDGILAVDLDTLLTSKLNSFKS